MLIEPKRGEGSEFRLEGGPIGRNSTRDSTGDWSVLHVFPRVLTFFYGL